VNDRIVVKVVDGGHEAALELLFGSDADVEQNRTGELGEEALDEVEPGAMFGMKVNSNLPAGCSASQARVSRETWAE